MNQHLSKTDFPWQTSNAAIAFSLYLAGIPFADDKSPLVNQYDATILRKLGYDKGASVEASAEEAYRDGYHGHIDYGFALTLDIGDALKAYNDAQKAVAGSTVSARVLVTAMMHGRAGGQLSLAQAIAGAACVLIRRRSAEIQEWEKSSDYKLTAAKLAADDYDARTIAEETFLTGNFHAFAAVLMDARQTFLGMWRNYPPMIRWRHKGSVRDDEGRKLFPGWVYATTNAPNEGRKNVGAPTK